MRCDHERDALPVVAGRQHEPGRPDLAVVGAVVNELDLGARRDVDRLLSGTCSAHNDQRGRNDEQQSHPSER